jgi:hypothetical protein
MAEDHVITFIKEERAKGVPDETIKIMLDANGWSLNDITRAYRSLSTNQDGNKMSKKHKILWGVLLVIAVGIIVWFFVH